MNAAARGHLAMLLFSVLVAGSFALGVQVANLVAPTAFTALRFLLATAIIGAILLFRGGASHKAWKAPWRYLLLGSIFASYFVLMFEGLKTASPVSAAAVFTLTPILSAGFGWLLLRQITTPRIALALGIGAAGALWVIFRADWRAAIGFEIGSGEAIYFVGCIFHALYTPLVRRLNHGETAIEFSFGTMLAGTAVLGAYGFPKILATDWLALPPIVWITLGYTAIFASAATFVLLQYATLRLPSAKVMAYTYLTPGWVVLWQVAMGQPAPPVLIAAGLVLTTIALLLLMGRDMMVVVDRPRSN